jgi:hypothetical protein
LAFQKDAIMPTRTAKSSKTTVKTKPKAATSKLRKTAIKSKSTTKASVKTKPVKLLSGGNPQITMGDGDAPVRAYIAAMPGWKSDIGKCLDTIIVRNVPNVRKVVKWNTPFYGVEGKGWFLGFHTYANYVQVAFFQGTSLRPVPPGASKVKEVRYLKIHEDDLDEAQLAKWVKQAAALPGVVPWN